MTPEEKKAAEAKAEAEKAEKEKADADFEASIADLSDEEKEAKRAEKDAGSVEIDYEAELKKEREARVRAEEDRKKAENALAEKRFKSKQEDEDEDEDDKPLTKSQLEDLLAREREYSKKEIQAERISEIAKGLTSSPSEASLIIEIHKNRSFPANLSLQEQMEEAFAIANRKKLVSERNEAMRALKNKGNVKNDSAGTHHDGMKTPDSPKETGVDAQALKAAGYARNPQTRRWEKKLQNGTLIYRDERTGQTVVVKPR